MRARFSVISTCLAVGLLLCSCSGGHAPPDAMPVSHGDGWWVDPQLDEEISKARAKIATQWYETLYAQREVVCEVDDQEEPEMACPGGKCQRREEVDRWAARLAAVVVASAHDHLDIPDEDRPIGESLADESKPPPTPDSWFCPGGPIAAECLEDIIDEAIKPRIKRQFSDFPPTMQAYLLEAYHRDVSWMLEFVVDYRTPRRGLEMYREVCDEEGTPMTDVVEDVLIPDLRERWGWSEESKFPEGLPQSQLESFVFERCRAATDLHDHYLERLVDELESIQQSKPRCFDSSA